MVSVKFNEGMWNHDVLLWRDQCAYIEDLDISDPEKITIGAKSINLFNTTSHDIVVSNDSVFFGTNDWKILDFSGVLRWTIDTKAIVAFFQQSWKYYFWHNNQKISRSDTNRTWSPATQIETDAFSSARSTVKTLNKVMPYAADAVYFTPTVLSGQWGVNDMAWWVVSSVIYINFVDGTPWIGIRPQGTDYRVVSTKGNFYFWDGVLTKPSVRFDRDWFFWHAGLYAGMPLVLSGGKSKNSALRAINWVDKEVLAIADNSGNIEWKKRFYFWRNFELNTQNDDLGFSVFWWNEIMSANSDKIFFVW
jgi:hypothetical protein